MLIKRVGIIRKAWERLEVITSSGILLMYWYEHSREYELFKKYVGMRVDITYVVKEKQSSVNEGWELDE